MKTLKNITKTILSLALGMTVIACEDNIEDIQNNSILKLNVNTSAIQTRGGLIESKTLPDGHSIGLLLVDNSDTKYDGVTYNNIQATASIGKTPQKWEVKQDISLTETKGTLYAYYPWNNTVADFTKIPVEVVSQTDYMYATPVTALDGTNCDAQLTMKHAMAAVRLNIVKGTYTGAGKITNIAIKAENIAHTALMNAKTGILSSVGDVNNAINREVDITLTNQTHKEDIIVVPVNDIAAKPTITIMIDGKEYEAQGEAFTTQQGYIYTYKITLNAGGVDLSSVDMGEWGYDTNGKPVVDVGYNVNVAGNTQNIAFNIIKENETVKIIAMPTIEGKGVEEATLQDGGADLEQSYRFTNGMRIITLSNIVKDVTLNFDGVDDKMALVTEWVELTYSVPDENWMCQWLYSCEDSEVAMMMVQENDGEPIEITPTPEYCFNSIGEHKVYMLFNSGNIPEWVFSYCSGLTEVSIPNSVTSIGEYAFQECTALQNVNIPNSVTSIGEAAFGMTGLTSVTIPNSVTSIGILAFAGCTGLQNVTIPNSVTTIGQEAFAGCTALTSIVVNSGNTKYDSRNNCNAIMETATNKLIAGCNNTTIPNDCQIIGEAAFAGCTTLTSIIVPDSVTNISAYAFSGCTALTSVIIPDNVTTIGINAFQYCSALSSVTLGKELTAIDTCAFRDCTALTSIVIPDKVTSIGSCAFANCIELESVTIGENVQTIEEEAFQGTALTSITIPNSVQIIGKMAFYGCTALKEIKSLAMTAPQLNAGVWVFGEVAKNGVLFIKSGATGYNAWMDVLPSNWEMINIS